MLRPKDLLHELDVKPGEYGAKIVDAFAGASQKSGSKMITVVCVTTGEKSFRVWDHFVQEHPVAGRRMLNLLASVGMLDQEEVKEADLIGKTFRIRIAVEKFEGLPHPRIKRYMSANVKESANAAVQREK